MSIDLTKDIDCLRIMAKKSYAVASTEKEDCAFWHDVATGEAFDELAGNLQKTADRLAELEADGKRKDSFLVAYQCQVNELESSVKELAEILITNGITGFSVRDDLMPQALQQKESDNG